MSIPKVEAAPLTIEEKIQLAFPDAPVMLAIAKAESNLIATSTNPKSSAKGLFQILSGTWKHFECTGNSFDIDDNIACAKKIYAKNGTKDWNESKATWGSTK